MSFLKSDWFVAALALQIERTNYRIPDILNMNPIRLLPGAREVHPQPELQVCAYIALLGRVRIQESQIMMNI
jgi:hypothetical protein